MLVLILRLASLCWCICGSKTSASATMRLPLRSCSVKLVCMLASTAPVSSAPVPCLCILPLAGSLWKVFGLRPVQSTLTPSCYDSLLSLLFGWLPPWHGTLLAQLLCCIMQGLHWLILFFDSCTAIRRYLPLCCYLGLDWVYCTLVTVGRCVQYLACCFTLPLTRPRQECN